MQQAAGKPALITPTPCLRLAINLTKPTTMLAAPPRASTEPGTPEADEADEVDAVHTEAERRAKLQQHLSAALSTAMVPCRPMVSRSAEALVGRTASEPGDDAPEDAAYWDLVGTLS